MVSYLSANDLLVFQVGHKVVVYFRSREGCLRLWSSHFITATYKERVAVTGVEGYAGFSAAVKELGLLALAIRTQAQRLGNTVAHLTVTLYGDSADASCDKGCQTSLRISQGCPCLPFVHQHVVVVVEGVANLDGSIGVVQVILNAGIITRIVSNGIRINIMVLVGTQKVFHRLVVHSLVGCQLDAQV